MFLFAIHKEIVLIIQNSPHGFQQSILTLFNRLVKEGKCVIMVSSEMPEILAMSDRVMVMRGGRVMAMVERDSEHFNQEDIMKAAWGGKLE